MIVTIKKPIGFKHFHFKGPRDPSWVIRLEDKSNHNIIFKDKREAISRQKKKKERESVRLTELKHKSLLKTMK